MPGAESSEPEPSGVELDSPDSPLGLSGGAPSSSRLRRRSSAIDCDRAATFWPSCVTHSGTCRFSLKWERSQPRRQLPKRHAAVRDSELGFFGDLGEGRAVRRVIEDRVVSESAGAAGLIRNPGIVATANHCVSAIPYVCAAAPGIRSYLDLPLIAGRAAPALHRG